MTGSGFARGSDKSQRECCAAPTQPSPLYLATMLHSEFSDLAHIR